MSTAQKNIAWASARDIGVATPGDGTVHVYADGACSGNPGPGGWGAAVVFPDGRVAEYSGGERATTNNRMELDGAIVGIGEAVAAGAGRVVVYLDSTYVKDGITSWIHGWKRRGWKTAAGEPVKNKERWQALDAVVAEAKAKGVALDFQWVKGHAGNPGNEHADLLSNRHLGGAA